MSLISDTATPYLLIGALVAGSAAGAAFSWWVTSTSYKTDIATLEASHAKDREQWAVDKKAISDQAQQETAAALNRMKAAQDALALLDKENQEKLTNALNQNDSLQRDVAAGNKRVRILAADIANLAASINAPGRSPATGSVGDGTAVELTAAAGSNILDIRAGIIRDQAKIIYLQGYARDVVKQCKR